MNTARTIPNILTKKRLTINILTGTPAGLFTEVSV